MSATTRVATPADTEFVLECLTALHKEIRRVGGAVVDGPNTKHWVQRLALRSTMGDGVCVVAMEGDTLVGASVSIPIDWEFDSVYGKTAGGLGTYVLPNYRKLGVADALYTKMKAELTQRGYDSYVGGYAKDNTKVQGLLKRQGFQDVDTTVVVWLKEN